METLPNIRVNEGNIANKVIYQNPNRFINLKKKPKINFKTKGKS